MKRSWLCERVHLSWIIASCCLGIVVGVIASHHVDFVRFSSLQWLIISVVICSILFYISKRWTLIPIILVGLIIGFWRGENEPMNYDYKRLINKTVLISGNVLEDPDIDKTGNTILRLGNVSSDDHEFSGTLWVVVSKNEIIRRSDKVTVEGKISRGFGPFSASLYRASVKHIERPVPGDIAVGVRDWFAERVREELPEVESALGLGFLLGLRRALPMELIQALQIVGLTHVIVASGYNLTILVRLARRLFMRSSKYLAMLSATIMTVCFILITGMSPSMSRAGLVTGLSLLAWYYGRTIHPLVILPFTAAITLLINPQFGWNDLGWQLSFASFAGVILLAPLLHAYIFGDEKAGTIRQILIETVSAQVMTFPILMVTFGAISNVSILANLLVLPFVPLAMLLTFLVGIFSGIPLIGALLAAPTTALLNYMTQVSKWLANQSWAQLEITIDWWHVIVMYAVLALAMWWMWRQTKLKLCNVNIIE